VGPMSEFGERPSTQIGLNGENCRGTAIHYENGVGMKLPITETEIADVLDG
jgi:hypothetical protein